MKYLKIVNCPLSAYLIKKLNKEAIDWEVMGFNISEVSRISLQGYTEIIDGVAGGDFVTLLPISDEVKFEAIKQKILDNINNNAFENDTAEVVEQAVYDADKVTIENVKAQAKAANQI